MADNYISDGDKIRYGREALLVYQSILVDWYPFTYKDTYEDILIKAQAKNENWLSIVGEAVWRAKLSSRRLHESFERVVDKYGQDIQAPMTINQGIVDELTSFDFSLFGDAAISLAMDTAEGAGKIAEKLVSTTEDVGGGILDSLSFLGNNLKWIVLVVVGILLYVGFQVVKKKADV